MDGAAVGDPHQVALDADLPVGVDVVMIAGRPALEPETETIRAELLKLVPKALRRYREKQATATADGPR